MSLFCDYMNMLCFVCGDCASNVRRMCGEREAPVRRAQGEREADVAQRAQRDEGCPTWPSPDGPMAKRAHGPIGPGPFGPGTWPDGPWPDG